MGDFVDIKIASLDDEASGPSGEGSLLRIILRLSSRVPASWAEYFNHAWAQHFYMMKRRASVSGDSLEIICMPEELEGDHIPELNKVIAETNQAYKAHEIEQAQLRFAADEKEKQRRQELSDLKGRIKFD